MDWWNNEGSCLLPWGIYPCLCITDSLYLFCCSILINLFWRIIPPQSCISFSYTTTWISHNWEYIYQVYAWVSEVAQLCPTFCNPVNCSPPASSILGILQARILECVVISFSRGTSRCSDQTQVSHIAGRCFKLWATREAQFKVSKLRLISLPR